MITCKCGKVNQPTRKFCVRCGESLLKSEEEIASEKTKLPAAEPASTVPRATVSPSASPPSDSPPSTTDDKWVRPSEVPKDRLRTTSPSVGLSEMEKAKAAFSRAEEVGIGESDDAIVESRMLRASEVRELMDVIEKQSISSHPPSEPEPIVIPEQISTPAPPHETPVSAPPPPPPEVITSEITPSMESEHVPPPTEAPVRKEMSSADVSAPTASPKVMPEIKDIQDSVVKSPKIDVKLESADLEPYLKQISDPSFYQDSKIKDHLEDIAHTLKELRTAENDLNEVSVKLENDVRNHRNVTETKRIDYEALEEKLRLAKQEWNDAKKAFELAEKRMNKEVSTRQDRIKNIQKRLEKTSTLIERRDRVLGRSKDKTEE